MAKVLHMLLRRSIYRRKANLMSLDDPYPAMQRLLKKRKPRGIIDAGASNGHVSLRLLKYFPHATSYLFEPNPAYSPKLEALKQADDRICPQLMALSSSEGQMTLNITRKPGRTSLLEADASQLPGDQTQWQVTSRTRVPVVTIDQWKKRHKPKPIDLMKLDIQAGELEALRGASQTLRQEVSVVFTEVFFNPRYRNSPLFGHIADFLRTVGFELYSLYNPRSDKAGKLLWANALFIHPQRVSLP